MVRCIGLPAESGAKQLAGRPSTAFKKRAHYVLQCPACQRRMLIGATMASLVRATGKVIALPQTSGTDMDIGIILGLFIGWPFLALLPAAVFGFLFWRCRKPLVLVAAVAWLAYFAYEQAISWRILCAGECNIRVDLLLFYPLLALLSALAVVAYVRSARRANGA